MPYSLKSSRAEETSFVQQTFTERVLLGAGDMRMNKASEEHPQRTFCLWVSDIPTGGSLPEAHRSGDVLDEKRCLNDGRERPNQRERDGPFVQCSASVIKEKQRREKSWFGSLPYAALCLPGTQVVLWQALHVALTWDWVTAPAEESDLWNENCHLLSRFPPVARQGFAGDGSILTLTLAGQAAPQTVFSGRFSSFSFRTNDQSIANCWVFPWRIEDVV